MKKVLIVIVIAMSMLACEPNCETVENTDLVDAILGGSVVDVDDDLGVEIDGIFQGTLDVSVKKSAVITCDWFGYPEICAMTGTKGRALGRSSGSPTEDDITTYMESGSEANPDDLSSTTWYSNVWYPNNSDTSANALALRGAVASWGAGWDNARVDFCTIGNPNGTHIHCVQD